MFPKLGLKGWVEILMWQKQQMPYIAQSDANLALWGPDVTYCLCRSDEAAVVSTGRGWLVRKELRLWNPEFELKQFTSSMNVGKVPNFYAP